MRIKKSKAYREGVKEGKMMFEIGHSIDVTQRDDVERWLRRGLGLPSTDKDVDDFIEGFEDGHAEAQKAT